MLDILIVLSIGVYFNDNKFLYSILLNVSPKSKNLDH